MNKIACIIFCTCLCLNIKAQTLTKEAMNNFARYLQKPELSTLEKARKNIDDVYKTKKDSLNYKVNLIRALVYSSLAYTDSTRKLKYSKDPINEALFSLDKLKNPKQNYVQEPQIKFIRKQLSNAWLQKAKRATDALNYQEAYGAYTWVDSLSTDKYLAKHNLAVLSERLGQTDKAIQYYTYLISDKKRSLPDYYLALSNLYEQLRNSSKALSVIQEGRSTFSGNRDLLFKEINTYADNGAYETVSKLVDNALEFLPDNLNLIYLAGFSFEMIGKTDRAEEYYKRIISVEQDNYEGNYALGLLYLNSFLKSSDKNKDLLTKCKKYLVQAAEINPNSVNVLKSLTILYTLTNNTTELNRIKNKLSQIILN
ncbi:MAG: tetratricopeptide repeat protein [Sphingobacteriaceae bacterium]|nr:tetratricopeptide repeat protein [Sphingobacteriaceae bacterium]